MATWVHYHTRAAVLTVVPVSSLMLVRGNDRLTRPDCRAARAEGEGCRLEP